MAVVDADYTTCIGLVRTALGRGTGLTGADLKSVLAVLKDSTSRMSGNSTALTALTTAVTAQLVILQAKGTADASAEIDTADTTLSALVTAALAAKPTVPTYTTNTVADG